MLNAIAGASTTITNGNATAMASTRTASRRAMATRGEDNNITGSSVHAEIDQIDTNCTPRNGAITAGSSKGAQNAIAASRRSGLSGQAMSASVARLGRVIANARINGTAT